MLRVGTLLRGIYRIESYLSSGGFGNTYVATNIEFNERYAIKEFFIKGVTHREENQASVSVSNSENASSFLQQKEKFKKEARRLRQLNNPHIVKVHDLFEENGTAYYVMDYVDGESLAERLKRTGQPMSEEEVIRILPQILDALKSVHDAGLWHLDLKPGNILLDKNGQVKLIDFGASKQMDWERGGATASTAISLTNGYAPREQIEKNYSKLGPWTDIYALGATLYALLTNNHPPIPSDIDDDASSDKHIALPFPNNVSHAMRSLVLQMMKTNRMQRPQSIDSLRQTFASSVAVHGQQKESFTLSPEAPQFGNREETLFASQTGTKEATVIDPSSATPPPTSDLSDDLLRQRENYNRIVHPKSKPKSLRRIWVIRAVLFSIPFVLLYIENKFSLLEDEKALTKDKIIQNLIDNMVPVEGGTFTMGATSEQGSSFYDDEKPAHKVTLSSFSIGKYEVTQEEWEAVMGSNPSYFKGAKLPVEQVSWDDCQEFIRKLNALTGKQFRLPTEAEWEYAARGGNRSRGYKYSGSNDVGSVAWYADNSGDTTHPVGQKQANELGLYDMSGNVYEWCQDWWGDYSSSPQTNPTGPSSGSFRVFRGGSWNNYAGYCRVSRRHDDTPGLRGSGLGLRLAL